MLTIIEKVLLLQNVEVFSDVASEQLSFIAAIAQEVTAGAGELIFREGDAPDGLYVVIAGSVRLLRGDGELARYGPNQAFGVWALFDDAPRMISATAAEESHLLFIARNEFYDVLSDHMEIVEELFKRFVQRLRRLAGAIDPKSAHVAF